MVTQKTLLPIDFSCVFCCFETRNKKDYDRHILTAKHLKVTQCAQIGDAKKPQDYICSNCDKIYHSRNGLWKHKSNCVISKEIITHTDNPKISEEIILSILSQNNNLQQLLIEQNNKLTEQHNKTLELASQIKGITNNNTNNTNNSHNTTNNTTNNHFNLQIYLNETCKDAVNLTDFIDSLHVKLKDLEETARLGYSEGVSRIFINGLNELEVNKRPIHCSDAKRETLYVKDKNEWTKDSDKAKLTKAIKTVGKKNIHQISEWQKKYPEYNDPASRQNDKYLKMLCNAMNGSTDDEQEKNMEKIIRNITKEVVIEKN